MSNFATTLITQTLAHRWGVILLSVIVFLLSSLGLTRLTIDSDLRVFFSKDNPQLLQLEAVENTYLKNENILMVIVPRNNQVFSREVLGVIKEMTTALWQTPASSCRSMPVISSRWTGTSPSFCRWRRSAGPPAR